MEEGIVQRRRNHFNCEGQERKLLPQPQVGMTYSLILLKFTEKTFGKAKERIPGARDALVHLDNKESDLT